MVQIANVQEFFFRASLATYAGEVEAVDGASIGFPAHKVLDYREGDLLYRDIYSSTSKDQAETRRLSNGRTFIWAEGKPAWGMNYWGWWNHHDPRVIQFLKTALREAYEQRLFRGGRGPETFFEDEYAYDNRIDPDKPQSFTNFTGVDWITKPAEDKPENVELYRHWYSGLWLFSAH